MPDTLGNFSVRVSLAGIEPVGFRVKSDSRNHQAIGPRVSGASRLSEREAACCLGSSVVKNASPKKLQLRSCADLAVAFVGAELRSRRAPHRNLVDDEVGL